MNTARLVTCCLSIAAWFSAGCISSPQGWGYGLKRQWLQAVEEMKAESAILDPEDDGLDAFGPVDAKAMRAVRADMNR